MISYAFLPEPAHAIFADGAGAIALGTEGSGPTLVEHRTIFRSEHLGAMGFELGCKAWRWG